MSQSDFGNITSPQPGADFFDNKLEPWRDALHTLHRGNARPSYVQSGMQWIDDSTTPWVLKVFQGSDDIVMGTLDPSTLDFVPSGVTIPTAEDITYDPSTSGLTATDVQDAIDELSVGNFNAFPIGVPFPLRTDLGVSSPDNSGTAKFIELTYGKSGAGGYNEGLLTNEVLTGTFPDDLVATAEIVGGVMNDKKIRLLNTMQLFMRGAVTGGALQRDAIRNFTGNFGVISQQNTQSTGITRIDPTGDANLSFPASGSQIRGRSVIINASNQLPTAPENRVQNEGRTYFMRII